jgi:hypothetical protein
VLIDADCILVSSNDAYANDAVRQPNATMLALCTDTFVMFAQCKEAWVHPKQVMLALVHELDVQYNVLIDADCILVSSNDAYANDAVRQPNATMLALCTDTFVMFA